MMSDPGGLALIALLLPAVSFLILGIVAPFRRSGRPAAFTSIIFAAGSLAAAIGAWRGHAEGQVTRLAWEWLPSNGVSIATVGVLADGDSTLMLILVALVAFLVQLYSLEYLHDEAPAALGRYYTYHSLFAFSMMGVVLAPNLLQLFICWELVGLCSFLLIGFWYQKPAAARAAVKAFWTTKAGDIGLLIGIVLLWRVTGTFDLGELRTMVASGAVPVEGLSLITFCIYLGAVGKSAQFPLHTWLPDAMEGPTPVSALIHAATMVTAGVYLLHRTVFLFPPDILMVVAWIGAFTALLAAVLACVQDDIKRVLAYSTVSQLGYMMAAIGAGFSAAGFFHLLTHGLFKALLFLGAGAVIHAVHSNDLSHMGGLAKKMPQTAVVFAIGTLSLAGIPLFGGFLSKEEILSATLAGHQTGPFVLLIVVAFLTAFYMFRVVFLAFFASPAAAGHYVNAGRGTVVSGFSRIHDGPPEGGHYTAPHDPPAVMILPLWVLAALSLAVGVYSTAAGRVLQFGPGAEGAGEHVAPAWLTPAAVGVAIAGIALAWLVYQRRTIDAGKLAAVFGPIRYAALHKFWIDDIYEGILAFALLALSRIVGWLDRYLVDGVLNVVSVWTVSSGDLLRTVQTGRAQDYVYGVAVGLLILLLWMRWALT
jgi:NADH-quinone oxidoreductase subunit L